MQAVIKFLRANPQALVLLVICVVLGIGTFIAVIIALLTAPSDQTTGEPSGVILGAQAAWHAVQAAFAGACGLTTDNRASRSSVPAESVARRAARELAASRPPHSHPRPGDRRPVGRARVRPPKRGVP